jgi:hypothetical protein
MKAYTDLEQSKKLLEILPLESADMCYNWFVIGKEYSSIPQCRKFIDDELPCWSLAALLSLMPRIEYVKPFIDLSPNLDSEEVAIYYPEDSPYIVKDNLVDACVEMIIKLHEQNIL